MHRIGPKQVTLTCPHCQSEFSVPVQRDEFGPYAEIETTPCHHDECTKRLCPCCPQFACDGCGMKHCLEHVTSEDLNLCPCCVEPEPECACRRIDVDLDDARYCPLHGPDSELAERQREQEATDEAAWAQMMAPVVASWDQKATEVKE